MSKTIEIRVPDIGDFSDVPVIELLVSAGDSVQAEDGLVTLESDKATMEVPSPAAGVIRELRLKVDDKVSEGDVVAILEVEEEAAADAPEAETEKSEPAAEQAEQRPAAQTPGEETAPVADTQPEHEPAATAGGQQPDLEGEPPEVLEADLGGPHASGLAALDPSTVPYASPAVRKFARELGVDLGQVSGSGERGRILRDDVSAYVKVNVMLAIAGKAEALNVAVTGGVLMYTWLRENQT